MLDKPYIATLKFGNIQWQMWFKSENENEADRKWDAALRSLGEVGDSCSTADEFFIKAEQHFKKYGFTKETHNASMI